MQSLQLHLTGAAWSWLSNISVESIGNWNELEKWFVGNFRSTLIRDQRPSKNSRHVSKEAVSYYGHALYMENCPIGATPQCVPAREVEHVCGPGYVGVLPELVLWGEGIFQHGDEDIGTGQLVVAQASIEVHSVDVVSLWGRQHGADIPLSVKLVRSS
jgi:hypothetical protein